MVTRCFPRARGVIVALVLAGGIVGVEVQPAGAQPGSNEGLKAGVERQFQVLLLRSGVLLLPRQAGSGRPGGSIEVSDGRIAIDGVEVTGGELRDRVGADADLILQLSYLEPAARRALFAPPAAASQVLPRISPSVPALDAPVFRRDRRRGSSVRFGRDVSVGVDEIVAEDVVVFGGSAQILGRVNGDVVAIGGGVGLGPNSDVQGDVVVIGGRLTRAPGAIVGGDVVEMAAAEVFRRRFGSGGRTSRWWPFGSPSMSLAGTSLRVGVLMLFASLIMLVARGPVERIGARAAAEPVKAGLVGLLAEILVLPVLVMTVIVLAISIVGIPLLVLVPFAILALVLVLLIGFTSVASRVGRSAAARLGWSADRPYLATALGILILLSPLIVARLLDLATGGLGVATIALVGVGVLFEYVAWTVGFGASALAQFGSPRTVMEPSVPAGPSVAGTPAAE